MTLPPFIPVAHVRKAVTLEDERDQLGQRYSVTAAEREDIARATFDLLRRYELQGGRAPLQWLKHNQAFSHGTACNLRDAGYALSRGVQAGQGVTKLAHIGRLLKADPLLSLQDAQATADDAQKRKEAAAAANIGVNSVKYPEVAAPEMADAYKTLAATYQQAGLEAPDLPEMAVMMARLAVSDLTPAKLRQVEGSQLPPPTPAQQAKEQRGPSFYDWLAAQSGVCDCPNCGAPWAHLHHIETRLGRKQHELRQYPVLRVCLRHHQTGGAAAAHGDEGERAWMDREFGGREIVLELLWERAARFAAYLQGEK